MPVQGTWQTNNNMVQWKFISLFSANFSIVLLLRMQYYEYTKNTQKNSYRLFPCKPRYIHVFARLTLPSKTCIGTSILISRLHKNVQK